MLVAWRPQIASRTKADWSCDVFCGIRKNNFGGLKNMVRKIYSAITLLEILPHLPGANDLREYERIYLVSTVCRT